MKDYDDIEILDFDNKKKGIPADKTEVLDPSVVKKVLEKKVVENKPTELSSRVEIRKEKEEAKGNPEKSKKNKTGKKQAKKWEKVLWIISTIIILGCCIFYGSRLIHWYKIFNPTDASGKKVMLLGDYIPTKSVIVYEGDGLYNPNPSEYVYKGNATTNYLKYNNLLWRIIKINPDGTLLLILDDTMTLLPWDSKVKDYKDSEINKYLNENFLKNLDESYLDKNTYCEDSVENLKDATCDTKNSDYYVGLLDISTFLNTKLDSKVESKTYLLRDNEIYWLNNHSSEKVWHTNGENGGAAVGNSEANSFYGVRPVIKLKSTIPYVSGDGSKENPYLTSKENKLTIGSKVMLGEDTWIVYDTTNGTRLMLDKVLTKTYRYDLDKLTFDPESKESLAEYLNKDYLESLSYKDLLKEDEWITGGYTSSLEDLKKNKVKAKVAVPSLLDYQFDSNVNGYFTTTSQEEFILVYENPLHSLHSSKVTISRGIRPCISLTDEAVKKLKLDNGVYKVGA